MEDIKKKWNIKLEDIEDVEISNKFTIKRDRAKQIMDARTRNHQFFSKVAHNQSLYEKEGGVFSEGSTQAIKRKLRSQTIQRVPDGIITTQFDKNSIEQVETEFIFKHKILRSEWDGRDMLKNLTRSFDEAYDYGFACVRTGFENDVDGDIRVTFKIIHWNDIWPAPDCDYIEEANWYMVRDWISKSDLRNLLDEKGKIKDKTYDEKVVKYLVENEIKSGTDVNSLPLADKAKGVGKIESIETWTMYKRGSDEFKTYVPSCRAILRTVKNYDPRKDVPLHFLILEPDPEFPLGCSAIMWTLAQQQFADMFQTASYETLLLSLKPPLMGFGNLTPAKIRLEPYAFWDMGTFKDNKIEPFKVETTSLTQYGNILQNVSANMMKNLNVTDSTVASDANVARYSATPQGVEAQRADKTITINQYQKRIEVFFSDWSCHALRSYLASMGGVQELTVDEETRRKIWDIEKALSTDAEGNEDPNFESIIDGDKISIDFDALSTDMLEFDVKTGSLIENEKDKERKAIQELIVPISQMLPALPDEDKKAFVDNIMSLTQRLCELSDVTISTSTAKSIDNVLVAKALQATMEKQMQQEQMLMQMQQAMAGQQGMAPQPGAQEGAIPPEQYMANPAEVSAEFPQQGGQPPYIG